MPDEHLLLSDVAKWCLLESKWLAIGAKWCLRVPTGICGCLLVPNVSKGAYWCLWVPIGA